MSPAVHRENTPIFAGLHSERVQNRLFTAIAVEEEAEPKPAETRGKEDPLKSMLDGKPRGRETYQELVEWHFDETC